jgi:hypothetical protein
LLREWLFLPHSRPSRHRKQATTSCHFRSFIRCQTADAPQASIDGVTLGTRASENRRREQYFPCPCHLSRSKLLPSRSTVADNFNL